MRDLVLEALPLALSVLRFSPDTKLNAEACESSRPAEQLQKIQTGWKAFKVKGPLEFSLTGILSAIAKPLAEKKFLSLRYQPLIRIMC
ncbi:MAG TPA: hypothetical protein VFS88_07870 [Micavibrio sp.]|nr:hypothetical protein [Micavibrio sp.]